jgi:RNA polymerase sigma-70 factor (ECF subfamily)
MYSDEKLITDYLRGDEKSLEILIKRYLKPIYSFTFRFVRDGQEAEDITQEVFVKMWRNLKKFKKNERFKNYLFTIAKNTCFDFLRKKKISILSLEDYIYLADSQNFLH